MTALDEGIELTPKIIAGNPFVRYPAKAGYRVPAVPVQPLPKYTFFCKAQFCEHPSRRGVALDDFRLHPVDAEFFKPKVNYCRPLLHNLYSRTPPAGHSP